MFTQKTRPTYIAQLESSYRLHAGRSAKATVWRTQQDEIQFLKTQVKQLKENLFIERKNHKATERLRFSAEVHTDIFVKALRKATAHTRMGRNFSAGGYDALYTPRPPAHLAPRYDPVLEAQKARKLYKGVSPSAEQCDAFFSQASFTDAFFTTGF